jgi:hypothetical protein
LISIYASIAIDKEENIMSKANVKAAIANTIASLRTDDGGLELNKSETIALVEEIMAKIDMTYEIVDMASIENEFERSKEELAVLKECDADGEHFYTKGKIIAYKTVMRLLSK